MLVSLVRFQSSAPFITTFGRTRVRPHCALAVAFGDSPPALACGRRRCCFSSPHSRAASLRARGRLRRLPSGARLRPPALLLFFAALACGLTARSRSPSATPLRRSLAAAGAAAFLRRTRVRPHCALAVAFGDSPPALACGRRRCCFSSPHSRAASLRARGRLRRLPSGARLRPPALLLFFAALACGLTARSRSPSATP